MFTVLTPWATTSAQDELGARILLLGFIDSLVQALRTEADWGQEAIDRWSLFRAAVQVSHVNQPVPDRSGRLWGILNDLFV